MISFPSESNFCISSLKVAKDRTSVVSDGGLYQQSTMKLFAWIGVTSIPVISRLGIFMSFLLWWERVLLT